MHVNAVHLQPFHIVQVSLFGIGRCQALVFLELLQNVNFHFFGLVWHESKFGYGGSRVLGFIVIS